MAKKIRNRSNIKNLDELDRDESAIIDARHLPFLRQVYAESLRHKNSPDLLTGRIMDGMKMHPHDELVSAQYNILYTKRDRNLSQIDLLFILRKNDGQGNIGPNRYYLKEVTDARYHGNAEDLS